MPSEMNSVPAKGVTVCMFLNPRERWRTCVILEAIRGLLKGPRSQRVVRIPCGNSETQGFGKTSSWRFPFRHTERLY